MNSKPHFAPAFVLGLIVMFATQISYAADSGLLPRFPSPPMPERELNSWRFDSTAWQTNARTAPLALLDAEFAPSWSGYALRMSGTNPALAAFAFTNLAGGTNLLWSGSVRFWFAPDWSSASAAGTGPGADAVLFETGAWSSENSYVRSSLQVDADGDAIRFVLYGTGGPETVLSTSLAWNWNEWHQVALALSATNTVLYLDGSAAASGSGVVWLPSLVSGHVNGFCVGSDVTGSALAQGNFDELYTYSRAVAAVEVAFDYNRNSGTAALGPINPEITQPNYSISFTNVGTNSLTGTSTTNMVASLYGCKLWLEINRPTNLSTNAQTNLTNVVVTLHNTVGGGTYKLWTKQLLVATQAWAVETNVVGTMAQDFTTVTMPMNGRSNLFFYAGTGGFFTNKSFPGLQYSNLPALAPDTMGAVGPTHFVEILNGGAIAVYDKCSGVCVSITNLIDFFAVQSQGTNVPITTLLDSRILYDSQAERWVATSLEQNPLKMVVLAVSKDSSPLSLATNWIKYAIFFTNTTADNVNPDYPTLGVDENGIYLSVLEQSFPGGVTTTASNVVVAFKKPEIYQGTNLSTRLAVTTNDLAATVIQPAVNFDNPPRGQHAWFVAKRWRGSETNLGGALAYRRLQWNGSNAEWADTNWVALTNNSYRDYFDLDEGNVGAPQTNGFPAINLHQVGSRLMMATIRNGDLWTAHHIGLSGTNGSYSGNVDGADVDRSGAQWLRLSTDTNGNFFSITNGRVYDSTVATPLWFYFPSLMVNKAGDMVMGFSGSRSNEFIGSFYSYRSAVGTIPNLPILFHPGQGPSPVGRWGDYSYTSLDPVDCLSFWTVQQFGGEDTDADKWGTWILEILPNALTP